MRLNNLRLINTIRPVNIAITNEKIASITETQHASEAAENDIDFTDAVVFPGLINSHDHLDFNCFTPLGEKTYSNYTEWGHHIHKEYKREINAVLKIPLPLRVAWGMYKNLLAGVTTVVNHGERLPIENTLINIYQETQNLHSVKFQKNWKWHLNNPFVKNKTCVIHTGEGSDNQSAAEIDALLQWNVLKRQLVGVHAVAMNRQQAKKFAALVWCPESNKVLLNKHADMAALKDNALVVFGTDSTLTGNWNIWHHLRLARSLHMLNDEALFNTVTSNPACLWKRNNGKIEVGKEADLVIAKTSNGHVNWDNLFAINPESILMVIQRGNTRLFDASMLNQLGSHVDVKRFSQIAIGSTVKFVEGDIPALFRAIRHYHAGVVLPNEIGEPGKKPGND